MSPRPQKLENLKHLQDSLHQSHQEIPGKETLINVAVIPKIVNYRNSQLGYLTTDELRHVTSTYSTVYEMNISDSGFEEAVAKAQEVDPFSNGQNVNIELFLQFLELDLLQKQNQSQN